MPGRTMSRVAAATFTVLLVALSASSASASSPVRFGAKLTTNTQPSNSVARRSVCAERAVSPAPGS